MKISDIDIIEPVEYDRICIVLKDGREIETTEIIFLDDGNFEVGYIFNSL